MKKIFYILTILFVVLLSGCSVTTTNTELPTEPTSSTTEAPTVAPTEPTEAPTELPTDTTEPTITVATYTVSFDLAYDGANKMADIIVNEFETITKPEDPVREGYDFGGWYKKLDSGGYEFDFTKGIKSNVTLYATWDKIEIYYNVNYHFNNEENNDSIPTSVLSGELADKTIVPPTRDWFTFTAWYTDEECTTLFDFDTKIEEDVNLYAGWFEDPKHYRTVVFFLDEKMSEIYYEEKVTHGSVLTEPTVPTKEGYTFSHWANPDGSDYDFKREVVVDNNLYAVWTPDKKDFTITRDLNYTGAMTLPTITIHQAGTITEYLTSDSTNCPTRKNYLFDSWCTDSACKNKIDPETFIVEDDITIYAKWTYMYSAKYTQVIFYNNYSDTDNTKYLTLEWQRMELVTKPTDPTRTDYDFVGWYIDSACTTLFDFENTIITEYDTAIYASWEKHVNKYTVTFDFAYEGSTPITSIVIENEVVTLPSDPSREGYYFKGWKTNTISSTFYTPAQVTNDFTLYATWYLIPPQFTQILTNTKSGSTYLIGLTADGELYFSGDGICYDITGDGVDYSYVNAFSFIHFTPKNIEGKIVRIGEVNVYSWYALTENNDLYIIGETVLTNQFADRTDKTLPYKIKGKYMDVSFSTGSNNYALLLSTDGKLYSFGINFFGQLGNGTNLSTGIQQTLVDNEPVAVSSDLTFVSVSTTDHATSFAVDSYGRLWGWGNITYKYYLGLTKESEGVEVKSPNGYKQYFFSTPQLISDQTSSDIQFVKVISFLESTFLIDSNGKLYAMGICKSGELGMEGEEYLTSVGEQVFFGYVSTPTLVSTIPSDEVVVDVAQDLESIGGSKRYTTAVLTASGKVYTFGFNSYYYTEENDSLRECKLGIGDVSIQSSSDIKNNYFDYSFTAHLVEGTYKQIIWYDYDGLALGTDGYMYVWGTGNSRGLNYPYLNSTSHIYTPTKME